MNLHPPYQVDVHCSKVFIKKNVISHNRNLQFLAHVVLRFLEVT